MPLNPKLLAPCGLYCGVCSIYYADKHANNTLKQKLSKTYWCKPEEIECDGCLSDKRYFFCETCQIRACVQQKGIIGCHECVEWPCERIENYPYPLAKEYMLHSIPARKDRTDEEWVKWEEHNWICPACGTEAFRGARRCPACKTELPNILEK